jgi:hypothetical protein
LEAEFATAAARAAQLTTVLGPVLAGVLALVVAAWPRRVLEGRLVRLGDIALICFVIALVSASVCAYLAKLAFSAWLSGNLPAHLVEVGALERVKSIPGGLVFAGAYSSGLIGAFVGMRPWNRTKAMYESALQRGPSLWNYVGVLGCIWAVQHLVGAALERGLSGGHFVMGAVIAFMFLLCMKNLADHPRGPLRMLRRKRGDSAGSEAGLPRL